MQSPGFIIESVGIASMQLHEVSIVRIIRGIAFEFFNENVLLIDLQIL